VPLKIHERTLGSISVESDQPNAFTQEDERLLATLGVQATVALENARLYEAALRAAQRRHVLYLTGQEMVRVTQDLEQIYAAVHHGVSQLMPAESFTIVLLDESKNELEGVYLFDKGERWPVQRISLQGSFSGRVISSGQSLLIPDIEKTPIGAVHYGTPDAAHSILAVPMRIGERVIGVLSTQSYQATHTQQRINACWRCLPRKRSLQSKMRACSRALNRNFSSASGQRKRCIKAKNSIAACLKIHPFHSGWRISQQSNGA